MTSDIVPAVRDAGRFEFAPHNGFDCGTLGRIVDAREGTMLAEAQGRYVAASEARKRALAAAYGFRLLIPTDETPGAVDECEAADTMRDSGAAT